MSKTIIFDPKLNPHNPRIPYGISVEAITSPIRFSRPINRGGTKKTSLDAVETRGSWILPGTNLELPDEDYEYIIRHPLGLQLVNCGAFRVVSPTLEEGKFPTETTLDYIEKDALDLIRNSSDIDWLERSEKREGRPAISRAIAEQIKNIKSVNTMNIRG